MPLHGALRHDAGGRVLRDKHSSLEAFYDSDARVRRMPSDVIRNMVFDGKPCTALVDDCRVRRRMLSDGTHVDYRHVACEPASEWWDEEADRRELPAADEGGRKRRNHRPFDNFAERCLKGSFTYMPKYE